MLKHFFLRSRFRVAPGMRVVEGHVHLGMAHDRLNHSGIFLLVHKERRQRVPPEVVDAKSPHNLAVAIVGDPFSTLIAPALIAAGRM